jgi:purine nucleosidase/pyrimidine-specific ribonucleoside hydrolase
MAMILAAHNPAINLLGITTVSGNGIIDKVTENALRVCALANIRVPVAQGAGTSLLGAVEAASDIHGETALDGAPLPSPIFDLESIHGVELIAKLIQDCPEKVTLVATGPLTNIALFLKMYPELKSRINQIVFMGGSASRGNRTPYAEFNIWMDPEACDVVLKSGIPLTMIGLDVTHQAIITREIFERIDAIGTDISKTLSGLMRFFAQTYNDVFEMPNPPLHDPLAVAVLIDGAVTKNRFVNVECELNGIYTRGATVVDIFNRTGRAPNANVALELDFERFWTMMLDAVEKAGH